MKHQRGKLLKQNKICNGRGHFSLVEKGRARSSVQSLNLDKSRLEMHIFNTEVKGAVIRHWSRLPRDMVDSLLLEGLQSRLGIFLKVMLGFKQKFRTSRWSYWVRFSVLCYAAGQARCSHWSLLALYDWSTMAEATLVCPLYIEARHLLCWEPCEMLTSLAVSTSASEMCLIFWVLTATR